jgi:hypothetical protein
MPYAPGNLAEARLLLETLCRDWTAELMKELRTGDISMT